MTEYWLPSWWDRGVDWNRMIWSHGSDPTPPGPTVAQSPPQGGVIQVEAATPPDPPTFGGAGGGPPPAAGAAAAVDPEAVKRLKRIKQRKTETRR